MKYFAEEHDFKWSGRWAFFFILGKFYWTSAAKNSICGLSCITLIFLKTRSKAVDYFRASTFCGEMDEKTRESMTFIRTFQCKSQSRATANNTGGLWQSHREGRGKIMVAKRKRRSVSIFWTCGNRDKLPFLPYSYYRNNKIFFFFLSFCED